MRNQGSTSWFTCQGTLYSTHLSAHASGSPTILPETSSLLFGFTAEFYIKFVPHRTSHFSVKLVVTNSPVINILPAINDHSLYESSPHKPHIATVLIHLCIIAQKRLYLDQTRFTTRWILRPRQYVSHKITEYLKVQTLSHSRG